MCSPSRFGLNKLFVADQVVGDHQAAQFFARQAVAVGVLQAGEADREVGELICEVEGARAALLLRVEALKV